MPENLPKLTPEGKVEADSRYQQILSQYSSRFDSEQKALVQGLCIFVQPALERLRAFHLENGDAPAVYLKPLMERDKKPSPSPAASPAPEAAKKS